MMSKKGDGCRVNEGGTREKKKNHNAPGHRNTVPFGGEYDPFVSKKKSPGKRKFGVTEKRKVWAPSLPKNQKRARTKNPRAVTTGVVHSKREGNWWTSLKIKWGTAWRKKKSLGAYPKRKKEKTPSGGPNKTSSPQRAKTMKDLGFSIQNKKSHRSGRHSSPGSGPQCENRVQERCSTR